MQLAKARLERQIAAGMDPDAVWGFGSRQAGLDLARGLDDDDDEEGAEPDLDAATHGMGSRGAAGRAASAAGKREEAELDDMPEMMTSDKEVTSEDRCPHAC